MDKSEIANDLDSLGWFVGQALADAGLNVRTYGVLANVVYVELLDGRKYVIELEEEGDD